MEDALWLEELYHNNYRLLHRLGLFLMGPDTSYKDRIEDEIHEVFMLAWSKRAKLKSHPNVVGWLVEAMRRRQLAQFRQIRKEQKRSGFSLDDQVQSGAHSREERLSVGPEDFQTLWDKERQHAMEELLGKENAALFHLYLIERVPALDLARRLGITESCVRMRISRLKKKVLEHPEIYSAVVLLFLLGL